MKRNGMIVPVIVMVIAGTLLTGCPSDPGEGHKVKNPDITLKNLSEPAQHKEPVTSLLFTAGKTYVVTLAVTDIDDDLAGGFFGGVLLYEPEDGGDAVRVSEWAHSGSGAIVSGAKSYKWEFEATVSTPSAMQDMQYFEIIAQNSEYKNYKASDVFGIKGSISVTEKGAIADDDYNVTTLTTTPGQNKVVSIESGEFDKVDAAKGAAGSFLRLYITTTTIGSMVGKIGPDQNWNTTEDDHLPLNINASGYVDIDLGELFDAKINGSYNYININVWDGTLTKVDLWEKK